MRVPFDLVATEFLNEQPSLLTLLGVFSRDNFGNLKPVIIIKLFDRFGILNHEGEEAVLEEMGLVIFPLSEGTERLCGIFLLLKKFIKDLHCLLIRNNAFAVELVFFVFESDDVI